MKSMFFLFCLPFFYSSFNNSVNKSGTPVSNLNKDSLPDKLLVLHSFDAAAMKARKNKKELYHVLTDTLMNMVANEYQHKIDGSAAIIVPGIFDTNLDSNAIVELQKKYSAAKAIVIYNIDVYFEQKNVEVLKDDAGTHRNATYDLDAVVDYSFYNNRGIPIKNSVRVFHFFVTRSVMSGLFAAGPNIVSNKDAAINILRENVSEYFRLYFPW